MKLDLLLVKLCLLVTTSLLLTTTTNAQAPNCHWVSTLTGPNTQSFGSCDADEQGYLYTTGFKLGRTSRTNFFSPNDQLLNDTINNSMVITKTDAAGDFLWTKELIDLTGYFTIKTKTDLNGSFYIAGTFYGTAVFDPSNPSNSTLESLAASRLSYYIAKYTVDGDFLWARSIDALASSGSVEDINISNNGDIAFVGSFDSLIVENNNPILSQGRTDAFLAVYDSNGNFQSINT